MKPIIFRSITFPAPYQRIYRRLGFREGKTTLSLKQKADIDRYIQEAAGLLRLTGIALKVTLKEIRPGVILLARGVIFKSKNLSALVAGCDEILLMAATAGAKIMREIKKGASGRNLARSVVFDAAASEMTDAVLDLIMSYFNQELSRERKQLAGKRFSCGYGDFGLENQKKIYSILKLNRLGIKLTKSFILIPEKSVTAVAGIRA